jgi:TRAP-type uncharacterized transport system fused permease subunit
VDTSRLSQGDLIAGAGGIGLFIFLFLNWILEASAWEVFDIVDILLAAIGLGVVALVAARAMGNDIRVPGGAGAVALAGFAATMIVLTFVLEGEERGIGLWLSLLAALAITYGGWQAMRGHAGHTHHATTTPGPPPPPPAA